MVTSKSASEALFLDQDSRPRCKSHHIIVCEIAYPICYYIDGIARATLPSPAHYHPPPVALAR